MQTVRQKGLESHLLDSLMGFACFSSQHSQSPKAPASRKPTYHCVWQDGTDEKDWGVKLRAQMLSIGKCEHAGPLLWKEITQNFSEVYSKGSFSSINRLKLTNAGDSRGGDHRHRIWNTCTQQGFRSRGGRGCLVSTFQKQWHALPLPT